MISFKVGAHPKNVLDRQQERVLRERNEALQVFTLYLLSKPLLFTTLQEEQARQAKQIQGLENERAAQELLLQEKGAQIKVTKSF